MLPPQVDSAVRSYPAWSAPLCLLSDWGCSDTVSSSTSPAALYASRSSSTTHTATPFFSVDSTRHTHAPPLRVFSGALNSDMRRTTPSLFITSFFSGRSSESCGEGPEPRFSADT